MGQDLVKAVYDERSRAYHILTAIREAALAEPDISRPFMQFITDTQQEAEWDYLLISDKMYEHEESISGVPEHENGNKGSKGRAKKWQKH